MPGSDDGGRESPHPSRDQLEKAAAERKVREATANAALGSTLRASLTSTETTPRPTAAAGSVQQKHQAALTGPAPAAGVAPGGGGGSVPLPLDAFGDSQ